MCVWGGGGERQWDIATLQPFCGSEDGWGADPLCPPSSSPPEKGESQLIPCQDMCFKGPSSGPKLSGQGVDTLELDHQGAKVKCQLI